MRQAAAVLFGLAGLLLVGGVTAFVLAPEGASAATALAVPGVCAAMLAVCGALVAAGGRGTRAGRIGTHAGIALTLLFGLAFAHRGIKAREGVRAFDEARSVHAAEGAGTPFEEWARARTAAGTPTPDHSKAYLMWTLLTLSGASLISFSALLALRPKPIRS